MTSYYTNAATNQWRENERLFGRIAVHMVTIYSTCCLIFYHIFINLPLIFGLFVYSIVWYNSQELNAFLSAMLTIFTALTVVIVFVHIFTAVQMLRGYVVKRPELYHFYLAFTPITIVASVLWLFATFIFGLFCMDNSIPIKVNNRQVIGILCIVCSLSSILLFVAYIFFCYWVPQRSYRLLIKQLREDSRQPPRNIAIVDGRTVYSRF